MTIIGNFNFFDSISIGLRNCKRMACYAAINTFGALFAKHFKIMQIDKKPHLHFMSILCYCLTTLSVLNNYSISLITSQLSVQHFHLHPLSF